MLSTVQAKLLIVDDLPENLLALEALIKREDRQVYKALSADEALSLLLEHEFAMAILDVQMPGMNGFELAELMRGTEKTKNIPIVFVSAAGREPQLCVQGLRKRRRGFPAQAAGYPRGQEQGQRIR